MTNPYLQIQARLTRQAGLELWARISAARPWWDIELEDDGLNFFIPLIPGTVDAELALLEENCARLESGRGGLELDLSVKRVYDPPLSPAPPSAGPWGLTALAPNPEPPLPSAGPDRLILPGGYHFSQRFWAGEALLLDGLADHLSPPPGAPETRALPALFLEAPRPVAPLAARLAGCGEISVLAEAESIPTEMGEYFRLNRQEPPTVETLPFKVLARKKTDWRKYFGLIAVHLSPYLAARRLKILASWLAPEGALLISGFAPGPQTAHLLRAAAKAGLILDRSISEGDWAAMKLVPAPERTELPPLSGSVVPELAELPPADEAENADLDPEPEILDEESLLLPDDDEEDEA